MDKFQNKYRIPSIRLQKWDYRTAGAFFIAICTRDRVWYSGKINNGNMTLSGVGILAEVFWHEILATISLKSGSVSAIIRFCKSVVTKHANRLGFKMKWQERSHELIIRDDGKYQCISKYISNNPKNWEDDSICNK